VCSKTVNSSQPQYLHGPPTVIHGWILHIKLERTVAKKDWKNWHLQSDCNFHKTGTISNTLVNASISLIIFNNYILFYLAKLKIKHQNVFEINHYKCYKGI